MHFCHRTYSLCNSSLQLLGRWICFVLTNQQRPTLPTTGHTRLECWSQQKGPAHLQVAMGDFWHLSKPTSPKEKLTEGRTKEPSNTANQMYPQCLCTNCRLQPPELLQVPAGTWSSCNILATCHAKALGKANEEGCSLRTPRQWQMLLLQLNTWQKTLCQHWFSARKLLGQSSLARSEFHPVVAGMLWYFNAYKSVHRFN